MQDLAESRRDPGPPVVPLHDQRWKNERGSSSIVLAPCETPRECDAATGERSAARHHMGIERVDITLAWLPEINAGEQCQVIRLNCL